MEISQQEIDKCIKQAETIIRYYCNIKRIPSQDREEFYSRGMLGLAVALDKKRKGVAEKSEFAVNTYTNSFVRGYMMSHHTLLYEKRQDPWWYKLHHPKKNDISEYAKHPMVAVDGLENKIITKDFLAKAMPLLTEKKREIIRLHFFEGYTFPEIADILGYPGKGSVHCHLSGKDGAFRKINRFLGDQPISHNYKNNTSGVKGIVFVKKRGIWQTSIKTKGKLKHLGYHKDFNEAVLTRLAAEQCLSLNGHGLVSPAYNYALENNLICEVNNKWRAI